MYLLLFVITAATAVAAQSTYVVVVPAKFRTNMDFSLSVNILNAIRDVSVKAIILREKVIVTTATGTFSAGVPSTLTLKVPPNLPVDAEYTLNVTGSGGLTFHNSTSLIFNSKGVSLFIQSDKAIYKPEDTVNFRVFATFPTLKMYNGLVNISIYDAAFNKIKEWLQERTVNGVISKQLVLSSRPVLGDWEIKVEAATTTETKTFTVEEYVLPTFDVKVTMSSFVMTSENDVTATITAKYTYGKPVKGTAIVALSFIYYYYLEYDLSMAQVFSTIQVPIDGEVTVSFPLSDVKKNISDLDSNILIVSANITESLTGNVMSGNGTVKLYAKGVIMEFHQSNPKTFKSGLQYKGYLKLSQPDGRPVTALNEKVTLKASIQFELQFGPKQTFTVNLKQSDVPENGLLSFTLDLPKVASSATITAKFQGVTTDLYLEESYSPSNSYIQLFLDSTNIQAGSPIKFRVKATEPIPSLVYQIVSRGTIVKSGIINTMYSYDHKFSIISDTSMAPNARMVAYYVTSNNEIVTDTINFDVSGIFQNKVNISMNTTSAEPGEGVKVSVSADPSSTVYLLGIDQSLLLLKDGNDITENDVKAEQQTYDTTDGYNRRYWWYYPNPYEGIDASTVFMKSGVKVLTNAKIPQKRIPYHYYGNYNLMMQGSLAGAENEDNPGGGKLMEPTRLRSQFPETWMYTDIIIGANGTSSLHTKVPDTITTYVTTSIAVNAVSGFGIAPLPAKLLVFRSFFLNMNLPYSVIRGEQLALQVIVFNYMEDMQVVVTLERSDSYSSIVFVNGKEELRQEQAKQTISVKKGEAKSVFFPIVLTVLGKINIVVKAQSPKAADAMMRQLLVEPEGVPKEYNIAMMIDLNNGQSFSQTEDISLPANVVVGSQQLRVSIIGDIMGPASHGLDSLIQRPTGCGEQTILYLAPDIYVMDYLISVGQLSDDLRSRGLSYMEKGYQNELNYKHDDGSFSAFGKSDPAGSVWLTCFVARAFNQARPYIYIDVDVIIQALLGIIEKQNISGSFPETGIVIHKSMQSSAGEGTALTVYVLITLLETKELMDKTDSIKTKGEQAIAKALAFVESALEKIDDTYILAMAVYALQLAKSPRAKSVYDRLEQKAQVKDGLKYWHLEEKPATTPIWQNPYPTKAVDTEMTAYVTMAYILNGEIAKAKSSIQWIVKQINPYGGFQSTQDTVVALHALSQFAKLIYRKDFNIDITATLSPTQSFNFNIRQTNALILQIQETKNIPSKIKVDATGTGIALVAVAVFFNVKVDVDAATYELTVKLVEENINYLLLEICTRWIGEGPSGGMVIVEIGIPSGFNPDIGTITDLPILKLKEKIKNKVVLYFDKIDTTSVCIRIRMNRVAQVAKSQPVAVTVYNYYAPEFKVTYFYKSQILESANICDVSKDLEACK